MTRAGDKLYRDEPHTPILDRRFWRGFVVVFAVANIGYSALFGF